MWSFKRDIFKTVISDNYVTFTLWYSCIPEVADMTTVNFTTFTPSTVKCTWLDGLVSGHGGQAGQIPFIINTLSIGSQLFFVDGNGTYSSVGSLMDGNYVADTNFAPALTSHPGIASSTQVVITIVGGFVTTIINFNTLSTC